MSRPTDVPTPARTLALSGRFDAHRCAAAAAWIDRSLADGVHHLAVDLAAVSFIDSRALAELVRGLKACRERGGDLELLRPTYPVRVILELTRLDRAFHVVVDDAVSGAPEQ